MNKALEFLEENKIGNLATIGKDGKPKVRPFGLYFAEGGKLWFATASNKPVYEEILANPNVEFCTSSPKMAWIRVSGKVVFCDDDNMAKRSEVFEKNPKAKYTYGTAENPVFKPFYIENAVAVLNSLGSDPEKYSFQ
jgi:uncharacterized pyridoxamine 5'-phosphate oxidase family protein